MSAKKTNKVCTAKDYKVCKETYSTEEKKSEHKEANSVVVRAFYEYIETI